jgi:hypothetical protein
MLLTKHCLVDFVLQTPYQLKNKHQYGHPGGLLHGFLHVLGTLPIFAVIPPTPAIAAAIIGGEFVAHYHIDWAKEQALRRTGWGYTDSRYWAVFGADQLLHGLTYVAMSWALTLPV